MSYIPPLNLRVLPQASEINRTTMRCSNTKTHPPFLGHPLNKLPSVDDFTTIAIVGQGAYAMVRVVRHRVTNEIFALKQMPKIDLARKSKESLVRQEIDILYRADSPWIPKLYVAWQDRYFLYLLMEYTAGGDLMKHLADHQFFNEVICKQIMAELVLCLHYVHDSLHCAHRDVKPENVLIDYNGHIKLADFGLSKHVGSPIQRLSVPATKKLGSRISPSTSNLDTILTSRDESSPFCCALASTTNSITTRELQEYNANGNYELVTERQQQCSVKYNIRDEFKLQHGTHCTTFRRILYHERLQTGVGTTDYMAPEIHRQCRRQQKNVGYTRSADWWSVGVVLFDMLFGTLPFTDHKRIKHQTVERILNWRHYLKVFPTKIRVSLECEDFVRKLLTDPEERISSAQEAMAHPWFSSINWNTIREQWEIRKKTETGSLQSLLTVNIPDPPFFSSNEKREKQLPSHPLDPCSLRQKSQYPSPLLSKDNMARRVEAEYQHEKNQMIHNRAAAGLLKEKGFLTERLPVPATSSPYTKKNSRLPSTQRRKLSSELKVAITVCRSNLASCSNSDEDRHSCHFQALPRCVKEATLNAPGQAAESQALPVLSQYVVFNGRETYGRASPAHQPPQELNKDRPSDKHLASHTVRSHEQEDKLDFIDRSWKQQNGNNVLELGQNSIIHRHPYHRQIIMTRQNCDVPHGSNSKISKFQNCLSLEYQETKPSLSTLTSLESLFPFQQSEGQHDGHRKTKQPSTDLVLRQSNFYQTRNFLHQPPPLRRKSLKPYIFIRKAWVLADSPVASQRSRFRDIHIREPTRIHKRLKQQQRLKTGELLAGCSSNRNEGHKKNRDVFSPDRVSSLLSENSNPVKGHVRPSTTSLTHDDHPSYVTVTVKTPKHELSTLGSGKLLACQVQPHKKVDEPGIAKSHVPKSSFIKGFSKVLDYFQPLHHKATTIIV